jgi:hypothetical protein
MQFFNASCNSLISEDFILRGSQLSTLSNNQIGQIFAQWVIANFGQLLLKVTVIARISGDTFKTVKLCINFDQKLVLWRFFHQLIWSPCQGDQIGRIFAQWVIANFGQLL